MAETKGLDHGQGRTFRTAADTAVREAKRQTELRAQGFVSVSREDAARSEADTRTPEQRAAEWAARNPGEFGNRKSLPLTHGTIGWRVGNPTLKPLSGWTWDRVCEKLATTEGWMGYVRIKSEVNKEAILTDRDALPETDLKKMGVQVIRNEPFFIEPKLGTVATRQQTATA